MALLADLILVVIAATVLVAIVHRLQLPSILGFLLTGLLVGPVGLELVTDSDEIHVIAEIGVVLLMFTIGLEISLADLVRMARKVLGGGLAQILATAALFGGLAYWAEFPAREAATVGLLVATSSTALVLRLLGDRGELSTPYGQLALAILLMQDFAVVALMLLVPMLANADASVGVATWSVARAALFGTAIFVVARFVFPWVLNRVVALRSREVFLLATLVAVFGTAFIAEHFGLSLAIGAFIAGLVVSESDYSHQMFAEILPFRDLFNGLFFVSIGLLLQPAILMENAWTIVIVITLVLFGKGAIVVAVARGFRLSWSDAFLSGIALAQIGEFGLVLAQLARSLNLITVEEHGILIAVAVATITLTPIHLIASRKLVRRVDKQEPIMEEGPSSVLEDHVIVVGYGLNGRNVARALQLLDVPFVVVEMNANTVERERAGDLPIVYGDATRPALLHHLHVEKARALVAAVADAATTRDIVANAYYANPGMEIIARTRYIAEMAPLIELGATQVIPEEFETSIELVGRVMKTYGASERVVDAEKRRLRGQHYNALLRRSATGESPHPIADLLSELDVERVVVEDGALAVGKSLRELNLRAETGASVIAVLRADQATAITPYPELTFREGDVAVLAGDANDLAEATAIFAPSRAKREY